MIGPYGKLCLVLLPPGATAGDGRAREAYHRYQHQTTH